MVVFLRTVDPYLTKMTHSNLAIVFAPCLLRHPDVLVSVRAWGRARVCACGRVRAPHAILAAAASPPQSRFPDRRIAGFPLGMRALSIRTSAIWKPGLWEAAAARIAW